MFISVAFEIVEESVNGLKIESSLAVKTSALQAALVLWNHSLGLVLLYWDCIASSKPSKSICAGPYDCNP